MTASEIQRVFAAREVVVAAALFAALAGACDKGPEHPPDVTKEEAAAPSTAPAPQPAAVAEVKDDEWCGLAHEETVKLVEGIRASMKANGQDDADYAPPAEAAYVERCKRLPLAMQKCLVISYSTQNQDACLAAEQALSGGERQTYKELMGK